MPTTNISVSVPIQRTPRVQQVAAAAMPESSGQDWALHGRESLKRVMQQLRTQAAVRGFLGGR